MRMIAFTTTAGFSLRSRGPGGDIIPSTHGFHPSLDDFSPLP
jgi:hypothetical protein